MLDGILVAIIVVAAGAYLVRRHFKAAKSGAPQCGCGCSCGGSSRPPCQPLQ